MSHTHALVPSLQKKKYKKLSTLIKRGQSVSKASTYTATLPFSYPKLKVPIFERVSKAATMSYPSTNMVSKPTYKCHTNPRKDVNDLNFCQELHGNERAQMFKH